MKRLHDLLLAVTVYEINSGFFIATTRQLRVREVRVVSNLIQTTKTGQVDLLLLPFVRAADEAEAERLLSELITGHATPLVNKIINYKMRDAGRANSRNETWSEPEDIQSDVMLQLVQRLRNFRVDYAERPISDFNSYVAVTTYNACDRYISRKYPQRRRLKNGLRYLLAHREGFALWQDERSNWLGGFRRWQENAPASKAEANSHRTDAQVSIHRLQQLRDDPRAFARQINAHPHWNDPKHAYELLDAIFNWAGAPVELDLLTGVVAVWWNVTDETVEIDGGSSHEKQDEGGGVQIADARTGVAVETERRIYLKRLWDEITQLQPRQRAALLLNLRDENGRGVIDLWIIVGVATTQAIALTLEMRVEEFAALWSEMPLDDNRIAARLGVARQQVINLRKSARERLARRMKGF